MAVTALYSTHLCSFRLPALHFSCLPRSNTKLSLSSCPIVFVLYLCINYMVCYLYFFLSLTLIIQTIPFAFLCSATVRNFLSCKVFLQIGTDEHTPPSLLQPALTLLAGIKLLRLITAHTLPCINPTLGFHIFFLDYWPLRMGPIGCPETSVRIYHYFPSNNPEERSSYWQTFHNAEFSRKSVILREMCSFLFQDC